jgi:hypothetical protein
LRLDINGVRAKLDRPGGGDGFDRYRDDPVAFAVSEVKVTPWTRQAELLASIATDYRVAVRSGHKTGKSDGVSLGAVWFPCTRPGARVVVTAPTYRQVRNVLWKAIKRLVARLRPGVVLVANDVPDLGIQFANGSEILGFTADDSEKFAGISGAPDALMFIVDEASGVEEPIFEAIEGSAAGGARVILVGNPTRTSGTFFDAFHDRKEF